MKLVHEGNLPELLSGKEYERLNLIDYKIYAYGQDYPEDQFDEVIGKICKSDIVVKYLWFDEKSS